MKKIIFFTFGIVMFLINVTAQDYKSDFKKSAEFYKNATNLSMKVSVKGFENTADLKGSLISTGNMHKSGSKYYSEVMKNVLICDGKSILLIDHDSKQAIYKPEARKTDLSSLGNQNIDTLLAKNKGITYKGTSGNLLEYSIASPGDFIIQTTIFIDKSTFAIKKINYIYNQKSDEYDNELYKAEIEYSSISTAKPSDDKFKLSSLVEKKGKSCKGKGEIKDYQITELNANENYIKY